MAIKDIDIFDPEWPKKTLNEKHRRIVFNLFTLGLTANKIAKIYCHKYNLKNLRRFNDIVKRSLCQHFPGDNHVYQRIKGKQFKAYGFQITIDRMNKQRKAKA